MYTLLEALGRLFTSDGFVPRRLCGPWPDWLVWEHVGGNALTWLAYCAMPVMIWRLGRRKPEWSPFAGTFRAFAWFITLCGVGHLLDMLAFYRPLYRLSGLVLVATGLASWWAAWSLRRAWPALMALKSPAELERRVAEQMEALRVTIGELERAAIDRAYMATIVESSDDAIIGKGLDGVITTWNAGAERIFGYTAAEALGRPGTFLIPPEYQHEEAIILDRLRQGGRVDHFESVRLAKDDRPIDVSLTISPIKDPGGRVVGISKTARDITGRKAAESATRLLNEDLERRVAARTAELEAAKELAEAATRAKGDFLANMSHEIRTPMNGVIGMAELLLDTGLDDLQRDYARTIHSSGEALLTVINDILDFSKIEAGKMTLARVGFDLRTLMEEVSDLLAPRAHQKRLEMTCRVDPDVPRTLRGDPMRLRQVLTNLAGNAVKFTDRGEVNLEARVCGRSGSAVKVRIVVRDTGIGIAADRQSDVFESFTQLESGSSRKYGGTGLGLGICLRLVELMGGEIGLESEPGRGSTFWFEVTFEEESGGAGGVGEAALAEAPLDRLRVLVVDDHETNRTILRETLLSWGCRPEVTGSGAEAIARLFEPSDASPYRVALVDLDMPGLDGRQTARAIKDIPRFAGLPLILLSSHGSSRGDDEVDAGLFVASLTKPVRRSSLYNILSRVVAASAPVDGRPAIAAPEDAGLRPRLHILLAEDNAVNRKVATAMAEQLGCSVDVAEDGRQAVEKYKEGRHDLILMDVQMPEMDGFAATAAIREAERGSGQRIPIIALTAHAMVGDRERCLAAGMDGYLTKPIRRGPLSEMLLAWGPTGGNSPAEGTARRADEGRSFSREALEESCGGDPTMIREVLELMLRGNTAQFERLEEAIAAEDGIRVAREAHGLKGSFLTVGAGALAATCRELMSRGEAGDLAAVLVAYGPIRGQWERFEGEVGRYLEEISGPASGPSDVNPLRPAP